MPISGPCESEGVCLFYNQVMQALKVRVENGKIIGDAPAGFTEGTELELCLAEPEDEMTDEELVALEAVLEAGWKSIEAGQVRPAQDVIADLRSRR